MNNQRRFNATKKKKKFHIRKQIESQKKKTLQSNSEDIISFFALSLSSPQTLTQINFQTTKSTIKTEPKIKSFHRQWP